MLCVCYNFIAAKVIYYAAMYYVFENLACDISACVTQVRNLQISVFRLFE